MGDRCDLWMTYRKKDERQFAREFGPDWYNVQEEESPAWRSVYVEQANYGWLDQRLNLARRKVPFIGRHGEGGDYPAARFASEGGEHADVPMYDGELVCFMDGEGNVKAGGIVAAADFLELERRARKAIGLPDPAAALDEFYQLLRVRGDVEPELLPEAVRPEPGALRKAVIAHLKAEPYKEEDGLFYLHCKDGRPVGVHAFSGGEMDKLRKGAGR